MKDKRTIGSIFVTLLFSAVLGSSFIPCEVIDNYFQLFPIACGMGILAVASAIMLWCNRSYFRLSILDLLFVLIIVYYIARYDFREQLANWKIIYALLLLVLWFSARIMLSCSQISLQILLYSFIGAGCVQAIWGYLQLYGWIDSYHNLYAITGSFYNPGPYTGYIAMIFPVCLGQFLLAQKGERVILMVAAALMLCIIPAGMSRSAWGALIVSSLFVVTFHQGWLEKMKNYRLRRPTVFVVWGTMVSVTVIVLFYVAFQMKADSAYGRLFIWKNTLAAMSRQPILGYGPGTFPFVYGQEQSAYFSQEKYTELEEQVAGSPEYAFNEYLQMGIEGGGVLLLLTLGFILIVFKRSMQSCSYYGLCGSLLSLLIFSFSSYPFQVLSFGIVGVLISAICTPSGDGRERIGKKQQLLTCVGVICLLSVSGLCVYSLKGSHLYKEKIHQSNALYAARSYQDATQGYSLIYEKIKHNPTILFRYAHILAMQERYEEANVLLNRAEKVSSNATVFNVKGRNFQKMGQYKEAENCFKQSINRLPVRIYPYYLLAKLYGDSAYYHREQFQKMASIVLHKKPKVYSKAIEEMREEIRKLSIN